MAAVRRWKIMRHRNNPHVLTAAETGPRSLRSLQSGFALGHRLLLTGNRSWRAEARHLPISAERATQSPRRLRQCLVAVAACLLAFIGASPAAAHAQTISAGFCEVNAYRLTPQQRGFCGDHSYPLDEVHAVAYGGMAYTYDLPHITATAIIPPESFDAVTASEQERETFHIPTPPPAGTSQYAEWRKDMENVAYPAAPSELVLGPKSEDEYTEEDEPLNEDIWAGWLMEPGQEGGAEPPVRAVEARWEEPGWETPYCNRYSAWSQESEVSFWAGIDNLDPKARFGGPYQSDAYSSLAQDGTNITYIRERGLAWWEDFPEYRGEMWENGYEEPHYAEVGTPVLAYVASYPTYIVYYVTANGHGWIMTTSGYNNEEPPDERADFVAETHEYTEMEHFSSFKEAAEVYLTGAASWKGVGEFPSSHYYDLTLHRSHTMAYPSYIYEEYRHFNIYWQHCE